MHIGIDFDNTIVSYDALFHHVAREQGLIPEELPQTKLAVREHLRGAGRKDAWTEMQGYVYGARMNEAAAFPGVLEFLRWARDESIPVAIISHKTRHPYLGQKYDLHAAGRAWVEHHLADARGPLVPASEVYFELTKEEKILRIARRACTEFVDDLPEILTADGFPSATGRILFDPEGHHAPSDGVFLARSWDDVSRRVSRRWRASR